MYKCYPQDGQPNWKKCWQLIQNSFNVKQEFNMKVEKIWANFYSIKNFSFDLMKNKIWWLWRKNKINSILCNLFIGLVIDKFQFIYWIEIRIIQKKCQLLAFLKKNDKRYTDSTEYWWPREPDKLWYFKCISYKGRKKLFKTFHSDFFNFMCFL